MATNPYYPYWKDRNALAMKNNSTLNIRCRVAINFFKTITHKLFCFGLEMIKLCPNIPQTEKTTFNDTFSVLASGPFNDFG